MGSKYEWGENPIEDFFIKSVMDDIDISKKQNVKDIHEWLVMFYENFLPDENDVVYLDFEIKKSKFGEFKIVANNIITALWFKGIIPYDTNAVLKANMVEFDNKKYTFNKKTKVLTIKIIE